MKKETKLTVISLSIGLFVVVGAFVYGLGVEMLSQDEVASVRTSVSPPELGRHQSEHSHASFIMMIEGEMYDFTAEKYIERDKYTHFHADEPIIIHKHATGVTLPYFLSTLGIKLTSDCIILDEGESFCEDNNNNLYMMVDGGEVKNPEIYEIWHGDRIFLYYGNEDYVDVVLRARNIPEVPPELMNDPYGSGRERR